MLGKVPSMTKLLSVANPWDFGFVLDSPPDAGDHYLFRVSAENDVGWSVFSSPMEVLTAAAPPGPPGPVSTKDVTQASANLVWQPPTWNGGAHVMQYEVQLFPKSHAALVGGLTSAWMPVFQGSDVKCSVHGLRGGCTYGLRVRCFNQAGVGDFSPTSEFTSAPEIPEATPLPCITSVGQTSLDVSWERPPFDGGSPIQSYHLEHWNACAQAWEKAYCGPELTFQVSSLLPGTQHSFRVWCTSLVGSSPLSGIVTATTLPSPPSAVVQSNLKEVTSNAITLSWEPPEDNGAPVTSYTLEEARVATDGTLSFQQLYQGPATSFEVKGLLPFREYGFRLRACNSAGQGEWSPAYVCQTAPAAPDKPQGLVVSHQGSTDLHLSWQPPAETNGSAVTVYLLEIALFSSKLKKAGSWTQRYQGPEQSYSIDGLQPGKEYLVRIRAENKIGAGPFTSPLSCCTLSAPPDPPGAPSFSHRAANSVKVKWDAPPKDNGSVVSLYQVEVAEADLIPPQWEVFATSAESSARVTGLKPGTSYAFRVTAKNDMGASSPGPSETMVTSLAPPRQMSPPRASVALDLSSGVPKTHLTQVEVDWDPPFQTADSAQAISYEVEVIEVRGDGALAGLADKGRHLVTAPKAACSCIVPGLPGDSLCQIRIRAVGAGGSGHSPWSNATSVRTPPVEAPEPSTSSKSSTGDLDLPSSAMKKGARRAKQRKGRASAGGLPTQDAGRSSKAKILKNVTARPPPKKERLLSKKTVSWVVKVSLCVLFVGAMVFVIMLSAKTDWGPAPGRYAMHYANREMEARRHQYMADMYPYRQEVLDNLSPENQAKLAALQALSDEAQWHINQGKDLPPDFMQRMQDIELPAEILSLFDMNLDSGMQYDYEQHTDFHGDPLYQDGGTQYDYEQHTDFPGDPLYPERYTDEAD